MPSQASWEKGRRSFDTGEVEEAERGPRRWERQGPLFLRASPREPGPASTRMKTLAPRTGRASVFVGFSYQVSGN